ncbi:hypothetical protein GCM10029964_094460 [Kibdelosporangium lantanae]
MDHEIAVEQAYLDDLYARVDVLRAEAAGRPDPFWRAELARLESVADGLCFGRLDMADGRRIYVGRMGLFEDEEPLLLDWRTPAAAPFYTATMAAPDGVVRRRRITTRGRVVVGVEDELLDLDSGSDSLVGEGALLAALTAERTGRMRDVVTTLQAEQDRIVRDEYPGVLVVQGGPGTGKTVVALHRLAYLLYSRAHLRGRGVLVIGPSQVFLDYIAHVLPGLGEHAVVTATLPSLLGVDVGTAEGGLEMVDRIVAAVCARVWVPEETYEVEFEQQVLRLEPDDCRRAVAAARSTGLPHNQARLVFQARLVDVLTEGLVDRMENVVFTETGEALDGGSVDGRLSAADLRALEAAGVVVDGPEGPRSLLDDTDRTQLRNALLGDEDVRKSLDELWPALTPEDVVDVPGDVALLDEAAAVIGTATTETYGHVVVDEAQELSPMAWRMVMRRCPSRSMTVVGDLAQTSALSGASAWDEVLRPHVGDHWRLAELTVNYRTPAEIMAATTDLFTSHHPDLRLPRSVRSAGEAPWRCRTTAEELPRVVAGIVARYPEGRSSLRRRTSTGSLGCSRRGR